MIDFECDNCSVPMSSPDSLIGKSETCPDCRAQVRVPGYSVIVRPKVRTASPPPVPKVRRPPTKICPHCRERVNAKATRCSHCSGEIAPTGAMVLGGLGFLVLMGLMICFVVWFVGIIVAPCNAISRSVSSTQAPTPPARQAVLAARLSYLNAIPDIRWVEIDGNNVYIGFREVPADLKNICRAAAANGNRAIGFGVHVWAVPAPAFSRGWRPGDGPYYYEVTVRHGEVE